MRKRQDTEKIFAVKSEEPELLDLDTLELEYIDESENIENSDENGDFIKSKLATDFYYLQIDSLPSSLQNKIVKWQKYIQSLLEQSTYSSEINAKIEASFLIEKLTEIKNLECINGSPEYLALQEVLSKQFNQSALYRFNHQEYIQILRRRRLNKQRQNSNEHTAVTETSKKTSSFRSKIKKATLTTLGVLGIASLITAVSSSSNNTEPTYINSENTFTDIFNSSIEDLDHDVVSLTYSSLDNLNEQDTSEDSEIISFTTNIDATGDSDSSLAIEDLDLLDIEDDPNTDNLLVQSLVEDTTISAENELDDIIELSDEDFIEITENELEELVAQAQDNIEVEEHTYTSESEIVISTSPAVEAPNINSPMISHHPQEDFEVAMQSVQITDVVAAGYDYSTVGQVSNQSPLYSVENFYDTEGNLVKRIFRHNHSMYEVDSLSNVPFIVTTQSDNLVGRRFNEEFTRVFDTNRRFQNEETVYLRTSPVRYITHMTEDGVADIIPYIELDNGQYVSLLYLSPKSSADRFANSDFSFNEEGSLPQIEIPETQTIPTSIESNTYDSVLALNEKYEPFQGQTVSYTSKGGVTKTYYCDYSFNGKLRLVNRERGGAFFVNWSTLESEKASISLIQEQTYSRVQNVLADSRRA